MRFKLGLLAAMFIIGLTGSTLFAGSSDDEGTLSMEGRAPKRSLILEKIVPLNLSQSLEKKDLFPDKKELSVIEGKPSSPEKKKNFESQYRLKLPELIYDEELGLWKTPNAKIPYKVKGRAESANTYIGLENTAVHRFKNNRSNNFIESKDNSKDIITL